MLKKTLVALLLSGALPVRVVQAVEPRFITPEVQEELKRIQDAVPRWTSVHVRIYSGSRAFIDITEPSQRINIRGGGDSSGNIRFSGSVENGLMSVWAKQTSSAGVSGGYDLWGSGVNLRLIPSGRGYRVLGNVDARSFNLNLNRFGDNGWNIRGQDGVSLNASGFGRDLTVSGQVDPAQFDAKSLAALGMALAAASARAPESKFNRFDPNRRE